MTKQEFINSILEGALDGYKKYNIFPSITIAQAILESNWGKSSLSIKGNNLFGMKATSSSKSTLSLPTTEYVRGQKLKVQANFKSYSTFKDSIKDHNILLGTAKRYEKVRKAKDYREAAMALYQCGYATDPKYPQKLIVLIDQYSLYKYNFKNN